MKVELFDFQKDALHLLRERLSAARMTASTSNPQALAFSAPTGSGKTIMMTALFEALLDQPDDQLDWPTDWETQPDAVVLWVSDMPELNEQTRRKIEDKSDRIYRVNQLIPIDATFDEERLSGGKVYFINTQKLGHDKLLTKVGDGRKFSLWETLSNTARLAPDRFYIVIDEAHRGMTQGRGAAEAQTLMQRFVLGYPEVGLAIMPLVIGVSATPKRFMDLLEHAPHTVHKVNVPVESVRLSGLLKERILIHHPEVSTKAEMALLEEAARRWKRLSQGWLRYCIEEKEDKVWPVLVVQVENGTDTSVSRTNLSDALDVIEKAIGRRLNADEVVHAMHDAGDMDVGGRLVRKVDASRIDADQEIGVVFFKTNLSTGWDCPRAEVMMSFRHAEDHTYIAQLLGRMVRTPLARRIAKDAELNDVHLFLPHFDTVAVNAVVDSLRDVEDNPPVEVGTSRELIVLQRGEGTDEAFAASANLSTFRVNGARSQSSVRRLMAMCRAITLDGVDSEAWDLAKNEIIASLTAQAEAAKTAHGYDEKVRSITRVGLDTLEITGGIASRSAESRYQVETSDVDIDRLFEEAGRVLSHGLHMSYWQAHSSRNRREVKVELILLSRSHEAMSALEASASVSFDRTFDRFKSSIGKLPEHRRSMYEKLRLATAKPQEIEWDLPQSIDWKRNESDQAWPHHLYVEDDGHFRSALGTWEAEVLREEMNRPDFRNWLRNVDRKPWSFEIPYDSGGETRPLFPDLIIFRSGDDGIVVDLLEPHNSSLGDNFEKAVGLARFAERNGHKFGRIELIRKLMSPTGDERYFRLDLNRESVIKQTLLITSNPQLDALFTSMAY